MTTGSRSSRETGRPGLFGALLSVAALILLGVLIAGPALPMAPAVVLAAVAVGVTGAAWIVAGPRL